MPPKRKSETTQTSTPRRQSTRRKLPPSKSPYFEHPSEDEEEEEYSDAGSVSEEAKYGVDTAPENDKEAEDEEEEDERPAKPSKKRGRKASNAATTQLKPAKKKKTDRLRAPSPGGIEYTDDQIHPNTLMFLADLAKNNNRSWLHGHEGTYRAAKEDFEKLVQCISELMPDRVDETIPSELPVKDLVFRIHRDIRFSNDLTPYKTHFSAAWSRTGRKGPYACYYLQIKPGQSLAGGGLWHPEAQALALIRRSIDKHPERLKRVLAAEGFAAEFFGKLPPQKTTDEKALVKLFAERNKEDALKTAPKNYSKDHKDIELLRLKSFTISKPFTDKEVLCPGFLEAVVNVFKHMEPLITYLNSCVMPDDGDDSSDEE